jgi:hypothetical protein
MAVLEGFFELSFCTTSSGKLGVTRRDHNQSIVFGNEVMENTEGAPHTMQCFSGCRCKYPVYQYMIDKSQCPGICCTVLCKMVPQS